jgi:flagella basal body P-ring formation protein FlgA
VVIVTLDVPVPNRRLLPEEILTEADLTFVELPLQRLGAFAVQDAGELVGMQVRRMLIAGRPVPRQSVVPPSVVKRGEKVEIVFKSGGLQLTARGRALEDAYKNQVVQVVNLSSRKAIEGVAVARGVVEIEQ